MCTGEKPKKEENVKALKKSKTIKETNKKSFPHGKHFYNKEQGYKIK